MDTDTNRGAVVLDDGSFYVELYADDQTAEAAGFLQRRCYVGVTTPGGYECIGSFERDVVRGGWRALVDQAYEPSSDSDCRQVGRFAQRLDAIVALWGARHSALCRHQDGAN